MKKLIDKLNHSDHPAVQIIKYGMVGVLNTLVTLVVIFVCKSVLGVEEYLSNFLGYAAGILNSFIFNRSWVFHSKSKISGDILRFVTGCGICYLLQLGALYALTTWVFADVEFDLGFFVISGYGISTLLAMVVYTACNFVYNRTVAFGQNKNKTKQNK